MVLQVRYWLLENLSGNRYKHRYGFLKLTLSRLWSRMDKSMGKPRAPPRVYPYLRARVNANLQLWELIWRNWWSSNLKSKPKNEIKIWKRNQSQCVTKFKFQRKRQIASVSRQTMKSKFICPLRAVKPMFPMESRTVSIWTFVKTAP